jgi:hypothetical protein
MNKYPNGYYPKIEYWTGKLIEATKSRNLVEVDRAHQKLDYFIQRQWDSEVVVKSNTIAGVDFSESLNQLNAL